MNYQASSQGSKQIKVISSEVNSKGYTKINSGSAAFVKFQMQINSQNHSSRIPVLFDKTKNPMYSKKPEFIDKSLRHRLIRYNFLDCNSHKERSLLPSISKQNKSAIIDKESILREFKQSLEKPKVQFKPKPKNTENRIDIKHLKISFSKSKEDKTNCETNSLIKKPKNKVLQII